ncbi:MAG: hypothetical protein HYX72_04675 [Acidobacteria bacterium]|nr:hypothetical protein [Acidobacteriota bacterium]
MADKPTVGQAEVSYALLEYTATFEKPIIEAAAVPAVLVSAVLDALERWGYTYEGVELKTQTEKLTDYSIVFRRSKPATPPQNLVLSLDRLVLTAENPEWTEAADIAAEIAAALDAIRNAGRTDIQSQQVTIGMHIQVGAGARKDVTTPLLSPLAFELLDGDVKFPGIILIREKSTIVIDASVAFANALFVRISRQHAPELPPERLAEVLRNDEEQLFKILNLEIAL